MNILFPIETINRELDYKLVLAHQLAGQGHKIYIGQHDFITRLLPELEGGIYFGKNIFHVSADKEDGKIVKKYREKKIRFVYLHEEGAVYKGREEDWKRIMESLYKLDYFNSDDVVCEWGDFQKEIDAHRNPTHVPLKTTGHPRFDLYKPEWQFLFDEEVEKVKKQYGKYILINGNYTVFNHGLGVDYLFSEKSNYDVTSAESIKDRVSFFRYAGMQCLSMIELTHYLAIVFPEITFVYRPHPSENQSFYETVFSGVSNIVVNHEGAVTPWILGAEMLIHDGCTTAVEAYFSGKPIVNYKPVFDKNADIWLPNQLGKRLSSIQEVEEAIKNMDSFSPETMSPIIKAKLESLMLNFKGNSFHEILTLLKEKIEENKKGAFRSPSDFFIKKELLKFETKKSLYQLKKGGALKNAYHQRKFYGFDPVTLKKKILKLDQKSGTTTQYTFHNPYLIEIK